MTSRSIVAIAVPDGARHEQRHVAGAVLLGLAYFAVLMIVVLECPRPGTQSRHRRDQPEGAW